MFNTTPALRLYANWRNHIFSSKQIATLQSNQLLSLIKRAENTTFGKDHSFHTIKSVADFQQRVPLRNYEQFWQQYWSHKFPVLTDCTWPGTIPFFAVSSGTSSGVTKYIPFTASMQRSNTKAGIDLLAHHLLNHPSSKIFAGRSFILGGSTDLVQQSPGIFSGDLSGIAVKTLPWWAKKRYFPSQEVALLKNWEEKIDVLSDLAPKSNIRMISGVPSWMLIFFDALFNKYPEANRQLTKIFPNLEMIVHGGVGFSPYMNQFKELLSGSSAELREVYPASEGFIAIADRGPGEGMRLNLDHQMFFEFVPVEELTQEKPTRHWIDTVELDVNYAIVLTTCAGLWSYVIGDTIKFVDRNPARILVTGRTSYYLSAFGEHLIAEEIDEGILSASQAINQDVTDYSVGPVFPSQAGELGGHLYIVECSNAEITPEKQQIFSKILDQKLCSRNEDYEAHRAGGFGLKEPKIIFVSPGTFRNWMASRGKLGGQHKVPRIITDMKLFENLINFIS